MIIDYKHKYQKYKKKYLQLKQEMDFFVIHMTKDKSNIYSILDSGILSLGKDVPPEIRNLWRDDEGQPYVFGNIYFKDLKNIEVVPNFTFIFSSKIFDDFDVGFNELWQGAITDKTIMLYKDDSKEIRAKKMKRIRSFLKKPFLLGDTVPIAGVSKHELVIDEPIDLQKYLIAVICDSCDLSKYQEKYKHTQFITTEEMYNNFFNK